MRAEVGGITRGKLLKIFPEGLSIFLILSDDIGASQGEGPAEAGGFPNEFDIEDRGSGIGNRGFAGFVIRPMVKRFVEGQLKRNEVSPKHAEFSADNFIGFAEQGGLAVKAECLDELLTRGKRK